MRRLLPVLIALWACTGAPAEDTPKGPTPYRVAVDGTMKITTAVGSTIVRRSHAEFDYRVLRREGGVDVAFDRFSHRVLANGEELDFLDMSRTRILARRQGGMSDVRREQAPPVMLPMFEQFDPPLARIELGPDGAELSRKEKANEGLLVEAHALDLARLFHPRFPEGEEKWESPVVMAFGRGQTASGTLRYARRKPEESAKDGAVQVDVTGFLKVEGKHDLAEIRRGAYKVAGRQAYDPATKDWASGRLVVTAGFEAVTVNGAVLKGDGTITYTLTRREPGKSSRGKKRAL